MTSDLEDVKNYFQKKFIQYGATPQGQDWNSYDSQETRFSQLFKVIEEGKEFSILDYGCGYGAFFDFLNKTNSSFSYYGFDIIEDSILSGRELHKEFSNCDFFSDESQLKPVDYVVESGIFNIKLDISLDDWTDYAIKILNTMNRLANKGMAFNFLTKYSDAEYMKSNLYYADPCFYFDYCKNNFSQNVALLHDYGLYDFTILVRK
jgi:SAM-dependent methyltransferase